MKSLIFHIKKNTVSHHVSVKFYAGNQNTYLTVLLDLSQILFDFLLANIVLPLKASFGKGLLFRFAPIYSGSQN